MQVCRKLRLATQKIFRQAKYLSHILFIYLFKISSSQPVYSNNTDYSSNKAQKAKHSLLLFKQ